MTDERAALAADLREVLYECGLLNHDETPKDMADRLTALGWMRRVPSMARWAFLDTGTGDWIEVKPGVVTIREEAPDD